MNRVFKKLQLNPGLIAALDCFAQPGPLFCGDASAAMATERLYVHHTQGANGGTNAPWTVSMACGMARDILETEDLMRLKFLALRDGMKERGMGSLYEHIMGESIDVRQP
jgi:hypothetical protein